MERYKDWVGLVRTGDPEKVRIAAEALEARKNAVGLSAGEARLLEHARSLLPTDRDGEH